LRQDSVRLKLPRTPTRQRRGSLVVVVPLAVERHAHLIQLYLMVESGYELPDWDELLLWASRNPNPHRDRLREQVERGEFAFDRH